MRLLILALAFVSIPALAQDIGGAPRVVDGDTLRIGKHRIRLWGIDSPEMSTSAGKAAKVWLRKFIDGRAVRCERKDIDRYRRVVAMCFVGGQDLAAALVRAGHARDWPKYSGGYYR